ncbi:unnamed protein product, partial [Discosporangium mesarthrocarpum]
PSSSSIQSSEVEGGDAWSAIYGRDLVGVSMSLYYTVAPPVLQPSASGSSVIHNREKSPWRPSMSTPGRQQDETGGATRCLTWARRSLLGHAIFPRMHGWMTENTAPGWRLERFGGKAPAQ